MMLRSAAPRGNENASPRRISLAWEPAIRGVVPVILLLACPVGFGQAAPERSATLASEPSAKLQVEIASSVLPDSPGVVRYQGGDSDAQQSSASQVGQEDVVAIAKTYRTSRRTAPSPCHKTRWLRTYQDDLIDGWPGAPNANNCVNILDPYVRFLDTRVAIPMSPAQKGYLAFRNLSDPFNLATIVGTSAFTIGIDSHTAYGPGWKGFGKNAGVSLLQDATGEFFGTFAIPSITHEDPHYHRMPQASIPRRLLHAVSRTVIAQHDNGSLMPNYSTLLTYPIASEISNLYVPGIHGNGPSTTKRIFIGYALDPVNNVITEFLPDFAKHIHIRVIFVQQILNQIVAGPALSGQSAP
jgi:hypothetical protein